jgi:putative sigma-54 modulation protein
MEIQIHAHNITVNDRLQDYVEKKLNKLDTYLPQIAEVKVDLSQEHPRSGAEHAVAQLTVRNQRGTILRAEEKKQADIFVAVDMVVEKMYRQISRYKGKHRRRAGERFAVLEPDLAAASPLPGETEADQADEQVAVVRRKQVDLAPMSEEEAIDQLELLGHNFFIFYNAQNGMINVLYRRDEGGFGLLQPNMG